MTHAITPTLRSSLNRAYHGRCQYCGRTCGDDAHVDHIFPSAKGGQDSLSNYTLSCGNCNIRKSALLLPEPGLFLLAAIAESKRRRIEILMRRDSDAKGKPPVNKAQDDREKYIRKLRRGRLFLCQSGLVFDFSNLYEAWLYIQETFRLGRLPVKMGETPPHSDDLYYPSATELKSAVNEFMRTLEATAADLIAKRDADLEALLLENSK